MKKRIRSFAKDLNRSCYESEIAFECILNQLKIYGYKRNVVVGRFIVDFLFRVKKKENLAIEINGSFHRDKKEKDDERAAVLETKYKTKVIQVDYPFDSNLFKCLRQIIEYRNQKKHVELALIKIDAWELNPGIFFSPSSQATLVGKKRRKLARVAK